MKCEASVHAIHVGYAIQQVVVRFGSLPVNGESLSAAQNAAGLCQPCRHRRHAGLQQTKLHQVPAVQREVCRFSLRNHISQRLAGVDGRRLGLHLDLAVGAGDFQLHRIIHHAADIDPDRRSRVRRKVGGAGGQRIVAHWQVGKPECPLPRCHHRLAQSGLHVLCSDLRATHHGGRWIGYLALQYADRILRL